MKNPYNADSPEWQLFEQITHSDHLAFAHMADSERYAGMAKKAREKAETYRAALVKLDPQYESKQS